MNDLSNIHETDDAWGISALDLPGYFERIGYEEEAPPTVETLFALHRAHAAGIPFENIDVVLGRGISLRMEDIQKKLVEHKRGGYCFEHNLLFSAALEWLGFGVRRLAARVLVDGSGLRTHMLLVVEAGDREWLADVGFGATLMEPLPFEDGAVSEQGGWTYGLSHLDDGSWRLRSLDARDGWNDLYEFTEEPQRHIDYVVYNHFTSTHPDSHFLNQPNVVRVEPHVRHTLAGKTSIAKHPDGSSEKLDLSPDEAIEKLRDTFAVSLDPDGEAQIRELLAAENMRDP